MKKFKVYYTSSETVVLTVLAENKEQAKEIAENTDGGEFDRLEDFDWTLQDIEEINKGGRYE